MYDRIGLSTKCTLIKTGFKNLRAGMEAKFRPFVDALVARLQKIMTLWPGPTILLLPTSLLYPAKCSNLAGAWGYFIIVVRTLERQTLEIN